MRRALNSSKEGVETRDVCLLTVFGTTEPSLLSSYRHEASPLRAAPSRESDELICSPVDLDIS